MSNLLLKYFIPLKRILRETRNSRNNLGLAGAVVFMMQQLRCYFYHVNNPYILISKDSKYPLRCRPYTSDIDVFKQIFVQREYACLDNLTSVELVVDCGAYVGYSSAYFLTRFPNCKIILVEPDPCNFNLLRTNMASWNDRVTLIHAAIWSHPVGLKIVTEQYRDGREWTRQVRECGSGELPDIEGIDIKSLLQESGKSRISILKIDIEGAEAVVFSRNFTSWLPYIDNIVIELHDDSSFGQSSDIFFKAISKEPFQIFRSGELTVCKSKA